MNTATLTQQTYVTHNTTDSFIDLSGVVEQGVIEHCGRKQIRAMFGAPGNDSEGNEMWALRFSDGTVAGIRRRGGLDGGWSVAGKLTDRTSRAAIMVKIAIDLYAEAEAQKAADKHKASDVYGKLDASLESSKEILQSIIVGRGEKYGHLVEIIVSIRKKESLHKHMMQMLVETKTIPKSLAAMMEHADEELSILVITLASHMGDLIHSEAEAKEAIEWAERIMAAEQEGVTSIMGELRAKSGGK